MIIKNQDIITYYEQLENAFKNENNKYMPAKISFIINKNFTLLRTLTDEIYHTRNKIICQYGTQYQDYFEIPEQLQGVAQQELDDLLEIKQDLKFLKLKFSDIENLEFTFNQMEAIMFMIEEENEEDQVE